MWSFFMYITKDWDTGFLCLIYANIKRHYNNML